MMTYNLQKVWINETAGTKPAAPSKVNLRIAVKRNLLVQGEQQFLE